MVTTIRHQRHPSASEIQRFCQEHLVWDPRRQRDQAFHNGVWFGFTIGAGVSGLAFIYGGLLT
ncbi:hypothetical protein N825_26960 [Skermanella stibiiresistens SB22]|uniref:Uncharacterized protein n=1 Tax=Skermanella stibiiresistens SB22 TaxID=1385369 RepID=W9GRK3_9PROT|nr:hypothetical protein [Skermanella stibiiresistens]EWY36389.1 hypothetical protein N825_26960 [Skermanella stibiiresistens SB22]